MAYLNKKSIKRMAQAALAAEHPLLSETVLDDAVRAAYVQGCVLATLIDDEKVSDKEREQVRRIGLSLRMQDAEIDECFKIVCGLVGDDQKNQFVAGILDLLKPEPIGRYFIGDFEKILASNGEIAGDSLELLDSFGAMLFSDENWRQKKEAAEEERRRAAARMKVEAEKAKKKAEEAAARELAKQERIAAQNRAFYEKMQKFVAGYVDKKRVTRNLLLEIGDELSESSFSDVDKQIVFREIAVQWLKRVESLDLPELTGRWGLLSSSLRKKAGGELAQKEKERFEQVRQIAREALWMVICLVILESDVRKLPVEKWPIGKINKIIDDIGYRGFAYDNDVVSRFWCGRGFCMAVDGVEQLFKELLGVKNVWRSLFLLTDGQKKKLSSWMERRREFGLGALEEYAHSIGVPRYCDGGTVIKLIHGRESNGDDSSATEETEADTSSSTRKAVAIKKAVPAKKAAPASRKRR